MKLPACFPRRLIRPLILLTLLFSFLLAANAQVDAPGHRGSKDDDAAWEAKQQREREKQQNLKRQADLKKDTDKLLELATELKQYVDKTNEHTLSVDVIKKAEEIEKLAHSVKEKMKGQ